MLLVRVRKTVACKRGIYEDILMLKKMLKEDILMLKKMLKKNITCITHLLHEQDRWVGIFGLHEIQNHCPFLQTTLDHLHSFK